MRREDLRGKTHIGGVLDVTARLNSKIYRKQQRSFDRLLPGRLGPRVQTRGHIGLT